MSADDEASSPAGEAQTRRLLDFRSIGWVFLLSALLMLLIVWRLLGPRLAGGLPQLRGDGSDPASYGFDLGSCLVPREQIVASVPVDYLPALTNPAVLNGADVEAFNREQRERYHRKFLVSGDRVIGVELNGQARAYPLNVLNWHEVVNDEVGGIALCVTYNPLCDSTVVFERSSGEQMYEFGVSGLLYNSNLLLYDRQPGHTGESLWSQLSFRAIAGPAAASGATLRLLPHQLMPWANWLAAHPDTTVIAGDQGKLDRYNGSPYSSYFASGKLRYSVTAMPPGPLAPFSRVLAVQSENGWRVFPYSEIESQLDATGAWLDGPLSLYFKPAAPQQEQPCAWAEWEGSLQYTSVSCLWFAWYAMHPDVPPPRS